MHGAQQTLALEASQRLGKNPGFRWREESTLIVRAGFLPRSRRIPLNGRRVLNPATPSVLLVVPRSCGRGEMESSQGVVRCVNCGAMIRESARFCVECGTPVVKGQAQKPQKHAPSRSTQKLVRPSSTTLGMPASKRPTAQMPSSTTLGVAPPTDSVPRTPAQPEGSKNFSRRTLNLDLNTPSSDGPPTHVAGPSFTQSDDAPRSMGEALASAAGPGGSDPPGRDPNRISDPPISDILGDIDSTFDAILSDPGVVKQESSATDSRAGTNAVQADSPRLHQPGSTFHDRAQAR